MKYLLLSILSLTFFIGCSSSSSSTETREVINGFTLPPEPDQVINNSTLLGIDSNDNGVRDDVERFVIVEINKSDLEYKKYLTHMYFDYSKKTNNLFLNEDPTPEEALTIMLDISYSIDCDGPNPFYSENTQELIDRKLEMSNFIRDSVYSTKSRVELFFKYENTMDSYEFLKKGLNEKQLSEEECKKRYTKYD